MKKSIYICISWSICLLLAGCSASTEHTIDNLEQITIDQVKNIVDQENPIVQSVKNGYMENNPDRLIGVYFEKYFVDPTWTYFEAETGEDVVEFTGFTMYMETKVKARLQFIVDEDSFEIGALTFNDVPQNELVKNSLLMNIFEYKEGQDEITSNDRAPLIENDINSPNDVEEINGHDVNIEIAKVYNGELNGYPIALGDTIAKVYERFGEPDEIETYGGSYYLRYPDVTFFNDRIDTHEGYVSGMSFYEGEILGVTIGQTSEEVIRILGESDSSGVNYEGGYILTYLFGSYSLEFGADDENSPIKYAYYYSNSIQGNVNDELFVTGDFFYYDPNNSLNELSYELEDGNISGQVIINTVRDHTSLLNFSGTLNGNQLSTSIINEYGETGIIEMSILNNEVSVIIDWGTYEEEYLFIR